jgi:DNA-binding CsgD family transcriptional regulator/PAS domain-containing protein
MGAPDIQKLVREIYEAVLDPGRWKHILASATLLLGGESGSMGVTDARGETAALAIVHEIDLERLLSWQAEFDSLDPWAEGARRLAGTGTVITGHELRPPEELRRMELYGAFFEPEGIDDCVSICMARDGDDLSALNVYRSREQGLFGRRELARAQALAPHLVLALQLHRRIAGLTAQRRLDELALDRVPYGVIGLDGAGCVLQSNRSAERIFEAADGLAVREGRLRAPRAAEALEKAIREAASTASGETACGGAAFRIPRAPLRQPLHVLVCPVPAADAPLVDAWPQRRPAVLVLVTDPETVREPPIETVRRLFGLTPALARLAVALAMGRTLNDYAEEAGLSIETVRWELKQLLARTDTARQSDLVRLILSSVASIEL